MAVETNQDSQISPTPETNRFLEDIQQDASEILGWRQELGLRVKTTLAARAREFAGFGFFGRIPTTDDLWSDDAGGDDENSEQLGLAIDREIDSDDGYTHDGVVMTPDGVLWTGYANDGRWGEGFAFDFDAATEVPLEDYPRYFDEAIRAMKYTVDEKTGVHAAEFREKQAMRLAQHIQQIEGDNQKYGVEGAEFKSDYPKMTEKANEFARRIIQMRRIIAKGNSGISIEQLENLLGHIFAAQEYSDADNHHPVDSSLDGARELFFMAGAFVSSKDIDIGRGLYALASDMWKAPSGSSYLVRRANRMPYRDNQENERIYYAMAVHLANRYREGEEFLSVPEFKSPPSEIETDLYGTISAGEIADWLLNKSVAVPSK